MMSYPLQAAQESGLFDRIHVSTDSQKYADIAADLGFPVDFLRPAEQARNDSPMYDILRYVLRWYDERGETFDEVCMPYATAVLLEGEDLLGGYRVFHEHGADQPVMAVGEHRAPIERALQIGPEGVLQWIYPEKRYMHSQKCVTAYHDAGAFLFFGRNRLLTTNEAIFTDYLAYVLPRWKITDIDELQDLKLSELIYLGRQAKRGK